MNYLAENMNLPAVGTSQILMRRLAPNQNIDADGYFGERCRVAVVEFQKFHKLGTPDGVIGQATWVKMMTLDRLQTIDVIDGTDQSLVDLEAKDIRRCGGDPIIVYGASNGVEEIVNAVCRKAAGGGPIGLLRIHGHGKQGNQAVTAGQANAERHLANVSVKNFSMVAGTLGRLAPLFSPFGSLQLMGCSVGGGAEGKQLLSLIAPVVGVPVTAGYFDQLGGGRNTFIFEGPTVSAFPAGGDLKSWSRGMASLYGKVAKAA